MDRYHALVTLLDYGAKMGALSKNRVSNANKILRVSFFTFLGGTPAFHFNFSNIFLTLAHVSI